MKRRTGCGICKQVGHWHKECKNSRSRMTSSTSRPEAKATVASYTDCAAPRDLLWVVPEPLSSHEDQCTTRQPKDLPALFTSAEHAFKSINGATWTKQIACLPASLGQNGRVLRPATSENECQRAPFSYRLLSCFTAVQCFSLTLKVD